MTTSYPEGSEVREAVFDLAEVPLSPEGERQARQARLERSASFIASERVQEAAARERWHEEAAKPPINIEPVLREIPDTKLEITE